MWDDRPRADELGQTKEDIMITCGNCKVSHNTVEEVKVCYGVQTGVGPQQVAHAPHSNDGTTMTKLRFVDEGYYTIVFNQDTDDRITLRVRPHWDEAAAERGEKVVDYLRGADNTKDYTGFAFLTPHSTRSMWSVWKKFRGGLNGARLERALNILHGDPETAGLEYAMKSGNCYRCGRLLTVPASVNRGLGPVCAKGGRDA